MTTHKAQGTTVQNVFVVERDMDLNPDVEERNKLEYTAFTRAAKQLHILC
jgi:ATP-dependent exoDNAse (exonuclease V) alpha subunit